LVGQPLLGDDDSKRYLVKASHFERMPEVVEPRGG
jgi:hypothetical protein